MKHPPRKKWGQHFLTDTNLLHKLVRIIDLQPEDQILEIGPGGGALTELMAPKVKKYVGVEIDKDLYQILTSDDFLKDYTFINDDFLKLDLSALPFDDGLIRVIGNIPYNITSPIIFKLLESNVTWQDIHIMVQKEVAERLIAKPGTKVYGRLSVMVQVLVDVKQELVIPPEVFVPKPIVDSVFISLRFHERYQLSPETYNRFKHVVKAAFGQRRKMLRNSLSEFHFKDNLGIDFTRRPESLSLIEFILLAENIII